MDPVIAVRSQTPVPAPSLHVGSDRLTSAPGARSMRPVSETIRMDAVQQSSGLAGQLAVDLVDRDEDLHPAAAVRAAADAAREAYIRASIAAGLNPLPMP